MCHFRLRRMREMQSIVTDVFGVCQFVCHMELFGAVFAKSLWPLVDVSVRAVICVEYFWLHVLFCYCIF